jgi:26S proteasome regulatory subunit N2
VPLLLSSLSKSYNPHVRYGAAMAVGIACSGTNLPEAIDLLEPLLKDQTDFVRQGAMIATAMVFIQISKTQHTKVEAFRQLLTRRIETKGEPVMSKFGAILASGILDASGRNATLQLQSPNGHKNFPAIAGMALFTQYWYWYPLIHFICLSFRPTAIIGITKELGIPKWEFKSNARPSLFAYPEKVKTPEKKKAEKVSTAVLSTTKKAQEREKRKKEDREGGNNMDTSSSSNLTIEPEKPKEPTKEPENTSEPPKSPQVEKKPEPKDEILKNPARVTPLQLGFISFNVSDRFSPLPSHSSKSFGILLLKDAKPELPTEFVEGNQSVEQVPEVPLPKPFEYVDD